MKEGVTLIREEERIDREDQSDLYLISLKDYLNGKGLKAGPYLSKRLYKVGITFIRRFYCIENKGDSFGDIFWCIDYDGTIGGGSVMGKEKVLSSELMKPFFRKEKIERIKEKML